MYCNFPSKYKCRAGTHVDCVTLQFANMQSIVFQAISWRSYLRARAQRKMSDRTCQIGARDFLAQSMPFIILKIKKFYKSQSAIIAFKNDYLEICAHSILRADKKLWYIEFPIASTAQMSYE